MKFRLSVSFRQLRTRRGNLLLRWRHLVSLPSAGSTKLGGQLQPILLLINYVTHGSQSRPMSLCDMTVFSGGQYSSYQRIHRDSANRFPKSSLIRNMSIAEDSPSVSP